MSKYLSTSSSRVHPSLKKTGAYTITPVVVTCSACDNKFFDSYNCGGERDSTLRINKLFLDTLSIDISDDDSFVSSLKFCPVCSLTLYELDSLMTKMQNLQTRIQTIKDYMCATVTNLSFQSKYGMDHSSNNPTDSSNSFITSVREQVMQNWIALSRNENKSDSRSRSKVNLQREECGRSNGCQNESLSSPLLNHREISLSHSSSAKKPKLQASSSSSSATIFDNSIQISASPASSTSTKLRSKNIFTAPRLSVREKEPNALEIFDKLDEQVLQGIDEGQVQETNINKAAGPRHCQGQSQGQGSRGNQNNINMNCSYNSIPSTSSPTNSNMAFGSSLEEAEEVENSLTRPIKLEQNDADGWGVIESIQSFSNSTTTSPEGLLNNEDDSTQAQDQSQDQDTKVDEDEESTSPEQESLVENTDMTTLFYDESDSASGFIYGTTTIELADQDPEDDELEEEEDEELSGSSSNSNLSFFHNSIASEVVSTNANIPAPAISVQQLQQQQHSAFSHRPSILRSAVSRAANRETKEKSLDIQMCTLCYKYVVTGVKHNCEEKSTTTMYQCGYCNAVFHSERVLQDHVHRHIRAIEFPVAGTKSTVQCRLCKKQFPSPSRLALHMKDQHGTDVITCQLCPNAFKDISSFRTHMIAHTGPTGTSPRFAKTEGRNFPCEYCGKLFRLNNDLRRHLLIHTGEKPFSCNMCDKAFNRKHHLTTHIEVHKRNQLMPLLPLYKESNPEDSDM